MSIMAKLMAIDECNAMEWEVCSDQQGNSVQIKSDAIQNLKEEKSRIDTKK